MNWILYSLLANLAFVGLEFVYRSGTFATYWRALPMMLPVMLIANYLLFNVYRTSPSFLVGWAVLSFGNIICRFGTNWLLGEPLTGQMFFGIMLMAIGMFTIKLVS